MPSAQTGANLGAGQPSRATGQRCLESRHIAFACHRLELGAEPWQALCRAAAEHAQHFKSSRCQRHVGCTRFGLLERGWQVSGAWCVRGGPFWRYCCSHAYKLSPLTGILTSVSGVSASATRRNQLEVLRGCGSIRSPAVRHRMQVRRLADRPHVLSCNG